MSLNLIVDNTKRMNTAYRKAIVMAELHNKMNHLENKLNKYYSIFQCSMLKGDVKKIKKSATVILIAEANNRAYKECLKLVEEKL